jgi:type I restriction enzyme S subunit
MGQAPSGSSYNDRGEGLPLIAGAGDFKGGVLAPTKFTTQPGKVSKPGDIVLSIRASIGAKVWADGEYCLGRGVASLRARPELDDKYLWHWLTRSERDLASKGRGATFLQVNKNDIGEMPIVLPPLSEQRRIAAILDHADALRAKRRQVLAHLDSLTHSIFNEMFSAVPATSTVEAEASLIRTGPFGSQLLHSEFVDDGIAVLGLDNVVGNEFRWGERRFITPTKYEQLRRYTVRPGDVLISIMGTTGRCVVVPEDIPVAINTKHI